MVLKTVTITNFLSVRGTVPFDLDRNVTVLLGANDHGKSNLLQAILCLNEDRPVKQEEKNWDAAEDEEVCIEFEMQLSGEEREGLISLLTNTVADLKEELSEAEADDGDGDDVAIEEDKVQRTSLAAKPTAGTSVAAGDTGAPTKRVPDPKAADDGEENENETEEAEALLAVLTPLLADLHGRTTITFARRQADQPLSIAGLLLNEECPSPILEWVQNAVPRVELFQSNSGALQDSVLADQLATDEFEFLQGIFYYAGLNPLDAKGIFKQTDITERTLEDASKKLNEELRRLWAQGVDLDMKFHLQHRLQAIEFLANDPSVTSRKTRMSKRSTGVTQFFRLSVVLHARRKKNPSNTYIYLFDEPGIFLHPKGQKDLIQVFEQLSADAQIIYATHSLFLLNQNFPERHRLISRTGRGTIVDQKPYRNNWRLATDALGVHLTANILFCPCVLLVEGDSDPIYISELLRHFNHTKQLDVDANMLGLYAYSDLQNLRFLLQTFVQPSAGSRLMVLFDGDKTGKSYQKLVEPLCGAHGVKMLTLADGLSIEDYVIDKELFVEAAFLTMKDAALTLDKTVARQDVFDSWAKNEKLAEKRLLAAWFSEAAKVLVDKSHGASKIALARNYAFLCRERLHVKEDSVTTPRSLDLCRRIQADLEVPETRAQRVIEVAKAASEA